jgi:hypothetical protein
VPRASAEPAPSSKLRARTVGESFSPMSSSDASGDASDSSSLESSSPEPSPRPSPPPAPRPAGVPALRGLSLAAAPAPAPRSPPAEGEGGASRRGAALLVALLSPAFTVAPPRRGAPPRALVAEVAAKFGAPPSRVRLFSLSEVPAGAAPPADCERLVVEVAGARFSLGAIEALLAENAALAAAGGKGGADLAAELAAARREAAALARQLESSEALRQRGQHALLELKREFESLHREMVAADDLAGRAPMDA